MFYAMAFAHYAIYKYSWGLGTVSRKTMATIHKTPRVLLQIRCIFSMRCYIVAATHIYIYILLLFSTSAVQEENSQSILAGHSDRIAI